MLLGKAVPADEDTSSLIVQIDEIAKESGVDFRALTLDQGAGAAAAPAAPAPAPAPTDPAAAGTPTAAAPATEAAASRLPIGATVGAAGLPVMPY